MPTRTVVRNYKFRIYPNKTQAKVLIRWLETCRRLYNAALAQRKDAWESESRSISQYQQNGWLTDAKKTNSFYKELHSQVAQEVMARLKKAFDAFFRRVASGEKPGYPRFKGHGRYNSLTFPQWGNGASFANGKLKLSKVGLLKIILHREIPGTIKTVTIRREASGKWHAIFSVTMEIEVPAHHPGPKVGLDVGIEKFAMLSDGTRIENPKHLRQAEKKLKTAHRNVSRKRKGSRNRGKARLKLARAYEKVANRRRDFHHKESRKLVRVYSGIAVEDLRIENMVLNRHLAKSIQDAGWGEFLAMLECKAESAGSEVRKVSPHGSSQECSRCGATVKKSLSQRVHRCPHCGLVMDRDENAAEVLKKKAFAA